MLVNDEVEEPNKEVVPLPNFKAERPPAAGGAPKMEPVVLDAVVAAGLFASKLGNKLF